MMSTGGPRIALVHDELTRRGGAELVFEEFVRVFPRADVYALYAGYPRLTVDGTTHTVRTTTLQRLPIWFRRHPSRLLPLLPLAAEQLDLSNYDVVISSSSGFAKAIVTRAHVPHICYCHTPTRYLWEQPIARERELRLLRWPTKALLHYLRLVDYGAAQRVDSFLANSQYTAERIAKYYRRTSTVVYPPIDTRFFTPAPPAMPMSARPFLCVGRLTPSKHIEHAVGACEKLQVPLVVIGNGLEVQRLKKASGRYTTFIPRVSRVQLRNYYRNSRALLQPGVEDFGMAAVEAQACGLPVIAYGAGGIREIVRHQETGLLYSYPRLEVLAESLRRFITRERAFAPSACQQQALRFTTEKFRQGITREVEQVLTKKH